MPVKVKARPFNHSAAVAPGSGRAAAGADRCGDRRRRSFSSTTTATRASSTSASQRPAVASTAQIYAAPQEVRPGQQLSATDIAARLRRAGYNTNPQLGSFELRGDSILIKPGPAELSLHGRRHHRHLRRRSHNPSPPKTAPRSPATSSNPSSSPRSPKTRTAPSAASSPTTRFPPRMVQAVLAIEDRRFFEHGGINYVRTFKCAVQDTLSHHKSCGGSTLTQQLARGFFLSPDKTILAQNRRDHDHVPARRSLQQAADLHDVREPDQPRPARLLRHQRLRRSRRRPTSAKTSASSTSPSAPCSPA